MPIAIGYMNDDDEPIIHFSDEEKRGFPNADAVLAIFIPAAQKCWRLWDPVNVRMCQQTFSTYFISSMYSALQVRLRGDPIDFSDSIESNVPHIEAAAAILETAIEAVIPILATAFEKCRLVWTKADYDRAAFVGMVSRYMGIIGLKLYRNG